MAAGVRILRIDTAHQRVQQTAKQVFEIIIELHVFNECGTALDQRGNKLNFVRVGLRVVDVIDGEDSSQLMVLAGERIVGDLT